MKEEVVELSSVECRLPLADVYDKVITVAK
jgi:hypothetical protein